MNPINKDYKITIRLTQEEYIKLCNDFEKEKSGYRGWYKYTLSQHIRQIIFDCLRKKSDKIDNVGHQHGG